MTDASFKLPPSMFIADAFQRPPTPLDYVIPGLVTGTVGSIVSPGGAGKTFLALEISIAITGGPDLLELGIQKTGDVLYIAAEDTLEVMHSRLYAMAGLLASDAQKAVSERLRLHSLVGHQIDLMKTEWRSTIKEAAMGARLIVIDTLRRVHSLEENDSGAMAALLSCFENICAETGAALLFLHHTSKNGAQNNPTDQSAGRGSNVLIDNIRGGSRNLVKMTEKQAEDLGIASEYRHEFVQLTTTKINYGKPPEDVWLQRNENGVLLRSKVPGLNSHLQEKPTQAVIPMKQRRGYV